MKLQIAVRRSVPPFEVLGFVGRVVAVVAHRIMTAMRNRKEAAILAQADDRALADIGLTRTDLRFALSEPLWRDPTEVLARRAGERQDRQRHGTQTDGSGSFSAPPTNRSVRYLI